MSSTTDWRKLAEADLWDGEGNACVLMCSECQESLRAACDAIDELEGLRKASGMGASLPCMHCAGVFKEWRKVQARVRELELKSDGWEETSRRERVAREKAEALLKVAVDAVSLLVAAIDHKGPNNKLEVDALRKGRAALAKLKGEP